MVKMNNDIVCHAMNELKLMNAHETSFGKSLLNFLEETRNMTKMNREYLNDVIDMISKLSYLQPITPITEEDFEEETYIEGDKISKIMRCVRYPSVYKDETGKYWDDKAVAYRLPNFNPYDIMYVYQCNYSSKREITLPYTPELKIETIEDESSFVQHNP